MSGTATEQVVQRAFAQGAIAIAHAVGAEFIEYRHHQRQAARQHRSAIRPEAGDLGGVDVAFTGQHLGDLTHRLAGDVTRAEVGVADLGQGLGRAGGARRVLPAVSAVGLGIGGERIAGRDPGFFKRLDGNLAIGEELARERHAANGGGFDELGFIIAANDQLG